MTNDQLAAFAFLKRFAARDKRERPVGCLEGYAGTGKTWLVAHWLGWLTSTYPSMKVLVAAPTNKAVDVLRAKVLAQCGQLPNVDFRTLDSFLGYRIKKDDDGNRERLKVGKASEYDIVIVDEASMVKAAMDRELRALRVCLLYVGDPAQLQPVGEEQSPAFNCDDKARMTEICRQAGDSPIIQLATYLRHRVDDNAVFLLDDVRGMASDNRITFVRRDKVLDWAETAMDKGMDARMLAFDNVTVNGNNAAMHARRYPDAPLFGVGEKALVNEAFEVNDDIMLCNGELLDVLACEESGIVAEDVLVYDVKVRHPERGLTVNGEHVNDIVLKVAGDEGHAARRHRQLTDQLYEARREGDLKRVDAILDLRRPLLKLAPLRHAYASTVHKSQGSTYDVAFIDWGSIYRSREMRARLMYVAATRPAKYLVVATN
jgi:exodeoxyribonuclease-5